MTVVLAHDCLRAGQSQASHVATRLCRKKGIEHAESKYLRNPDSGIGDSNKDEVILPLILSSVHCIPGYEFGAKRQFSAFGHGIQGIQDEVYKHLLESREIGLHVRQVIRQLSLDAHLALEERTRQLKRRVHHFVHLYGANLSIFRAAVFHQSRDQCGARLELHRPLLQPDTGDLSDALVGKAKSEVPRSCGKDLVEVVVQPSGQNPDGFEALGSFPCPPQLDLLGLIGNDYQHSSEAQDGERVTRDMKPLKATVG